MKAPAAMFGLAALTIAGGPIRAQDMRPPQSRPEAFATLPAYRLWQRRAPAGTRLTRLRR